MSDLHSNPHFRQLDEPKPLTVERMAASLVSQLAVTLPGLGEKLGPFYVSTLAQSYGPLEPGLVEALSANFNGFGILELHLNKAPEYKVSVVLHRPNLIYVQYEMPGAIRGNAFLCVEHFNEASRLAARCIGEFLVKRHFGDLWLQTGHEDEVLWPEELQRPERRYQVNVIKVGPPNVYAQSLPPIFEFLPPTMVDPN